MNNFARIRNFDTLAMDNPITPLPGASRDQNTHLINRIHPTAIIDVEELTLGVGVEIGAGTLIRCKKAVFGDFVLVGDHCTIRTPDFRLGDYSRLNAHSYAGGRKHLHIGRNVYLGRGVYLDSNGGLTLEDNTAFGAYSQVWTHCQHGDQIFGLHPRWHTERELIVRQDAWCIGRVVISNATEIGERALVLNESNVLHDIPADTTWAGNPAKDVTDKLGRQFEAVNEYEQHKRLVEEIRRFEAAYPQHTNKIHAAHPLETYLLNIPQDVTVILPGRAYFKNRTAAEVAFLKWTSGKFVPIEGD